jgi:tetratricopeptide (TPR) repeat protein
MNNKSGKHPPLFTEDWQSYAYFRAGVDWKQQGEIDKARQMYLKALGRDPYNRGALLNLGNLDTEAENYEQAMLRLAKAKDLASQGSEEYLVERDAVWYSAILQLAAVYMYRGEDFLPAAENEAERLIKTIQKTLETIQRTKGRLPLGGLWNDDQALEQFLYRLQPVAEILHASIVISAYEDSGTADDNHCRKVAHVKLKVLEIEMSDTSALSDQVQYNLACYRSRHGCTLENQVQQRIIYKKALCHLDYALDSRRDWVLWACKDPGLKAIRFS